MPELVHAAQQLQERDLPRRRQRGLGARIEDEATLASPALKTADAEATLFYRRNLPTAVLHTWGPTLTTIRTCVQGGSRSAARDGFPRAPAVA
jgi:hypothetical protein